MKKGFHTPIKFLFINLGIQRRHNMRELHSEMSPGEHSTWKGLCGGDRRKKWVSIWINILALNQNEGGHNCTIKLFLKSGF